ncbi:MAG: ATP-binding protein [Cyclobacteriaceae bacterium]|nr:ATP-binding protein [Cyclobacteriaceae bacterium]
MRYLLIINIVFSLFADSLSQNTLDIGFEKIGVDDGLISDKIYDIKQDEQGFIWIATYNGLDRYDGNKIVHYLPIYNDSSSLPESLIKKIIIDAENNLWLITNSSYLVKYNRLFDNFNTLHVNKTNKLDDPIIISDACDGLNNTLWVATLNSGLIKFNTKSGTTENVSVPGYDNLSIYKVYKADEYLYLDMGDPASLLKFNIQTKEVSLIRISNVLSKKASSFFSKSIYIDSTDVLWVGTIGKGLYRMEGDKVEWYSRDNGKLSGNIVTSILDYDKEYLWVSTDDGGISILDKKGNLIQILREQQQKMFSLSVNNIENLFKDRQGVIWVSTYSGGINRYDPNKYLFNKVTKLTYKPKALDNDNILSFFEDNEGDIWIGTDGGGINKLTPSGDYHHFIFDKNNSNSVSGNVITNLQEDNNGQLWISTFGNGISIYNKKTEQFTRHNTNSNIDLRNNTVWDIIKDKEGAIWLVMDEGNVARYNSTLKQFEYLQNDSPNKKLLFPRFLFEDSDGILWCTFVDNGLWKIDKEKMLIEKVDLNELNYFSINHIIEDREHRIWMASERFGLVELIKENDQLSYKITPLLDGHENILFLRAIVEDDEGYLWLSSNNGIFKFDKNTLKSKLFTVENGLQSNQFSFGTCLKSKDGTIYFGGSKGYSYFKPENIKTKENTENIKITKFTIFDHEVSISKEGVLKQNISETKKIILNHDQTTIGFEFSELNFVSTSQKHFCYMLKGFDKEWFTNRTETSVRYTNLSPGNYTFIVKSSKNKQCIDANATSLSIVVLPPWWTTWWFRSLVAIMILAIGLFIHFLRIRVLHEQRKKLNTMIEDRTETIQKQNHELSQKNNDLAKSSKELNQANKQLDEFAYVISHDLKAPLRRIANISQWIGDDYKDKLDETGVEYLDLMASNVSKMEKLIIDILDYSRTGKAERVFETINLNDILNDIVNTLEIPKNFSIEIEQLPEFDGVKSEWYQILQNMVSNAIKYNDKEEGIIKIYHNKLEEKHIINVWDNGVGISEKHYKKVFEVFQTLNIDPDIDSTGIGLATVKKLVELNDGKISIASELGKYSCFSIELSLDISTKLT